MSILFFNFVIFCKLGSCGANLNSWFIHIFFISFWKLELLNLQQLSLTMITYIFYVQKEGKRKIPFTFWFAHLLSPIFQGGIQKPRGQDFDLFWPPTHLKWTNMDISMTTYLCPRGHSWTHPPHTFFHNLNLSHCI